MKIIECPRDAMQGVKSFIPTDEKVLYIQSLLEVGFDTLDFGSFVSPKVIPQMQDTALVLEKLDLSTTNTKLLSIIANTQGAIEASKYNKTHYLGFPFSISENFQMRNSHKTIAESVIVLKEILVIANQNGKEVVVYLSMGFGNPYGDPWSAEIVGYWIDKLVKMGVKIISLSDTIGNATPTTIAYLFSNLIPKYPNIEFGAHLHTNINTSLEKIEAAYLSGCKRFDGAIQGFGGCPMATDTLTGNMPTEKLIEYFANTQIDLNLNRVNFRKSYNIASEIFSGYH